MPVKILIETKNDSFPDQGSPEDYLAAVQPVLSQVDDAIKTFAVERIDRKIALTDRAGKPCGEIEVLRF